MASEKTYELTESKLITLESNLRQARELIVNLEASLTASQKDLARLGGKLAQVGKLLTESQNATLAAWQRSDELTASLATANLSFEQYAKRMKQTTRRLKWQRSGWTLAFAALAGLHFR
jgi:uncharacterized coiled-coil protein SlyX